MENRKILDLKQQGKRFAQGGNELTNEVRKYE